MQGLGAGASASSYRATPAAGWGEVQAAVRELMGDGEKAAAMRWKAGEWKGKAARAVAAGGSSQRGLVRRLRQPSSRPHRNLPLRLLSTRFTHITISVRTFLAQPNCLNIDCIHISTR